MPANARWGLLAQLLLVLGVTASSNTSSYLLPGTVVPESYDLKIVPYIEDYKFEGTVSITVSAVDAVSNITLHASENLTVTITSISEVDNSSVALEVKETSRDNDTEFLILYLNTSLVAGTKYVIKANFSGELQKDLTGGFYLSSYEATNGTTIYVATTHFEATYARKAFPCFDEPKYRANFSIALARKKNQISLSNMPVNSSSTDPDTSIGDRYWDTFEETPKMPTYLVAYIVGDLQKVDTAYENVSLYVREGAVDEVALAAEVAPKVMKYLEEYTNISYMLPKLDLVGMTDLPIAAMENWGLVIIRENQMLYNNTTSKAEQAFSVSKIVAHELSNMWFGDYVTIEWWSYSWIKEGIAEMLQYYVLDKITDGEYSAMDRLAVDDTQEALGADGVTSSIPLTNTDVETPTQIETQLSGLTHTKGASLYRMLHGVLGDTAFRNGLRYFLSENAYSTSTPAKLSSALQKVVSSNSSVDVAELIDSWTLKSGYPVISAVRNYTNSSIELEQRRFLWDNASSSSAEYWFVPYTLSNKTSASTNLTNLLTNSSSESDIYVSQNVSYGSLFIINWAQLGFYRVNYDMVNWNRLCASLKDGSHLTAAQGAALIDDAFALGRLGWLEQFYGLYVVESVLEQWPAKLTTWLSIKKNLWKVHALVRASGEDDEAFMLYVREQLLASAYEAIGWNESSSDSWDTKASRDIVTQLACQYGVQACKKSAIQTFIDNQQDLANVSANILSATLCEALSYVNEEEIEVLYEQYQDETDVSRRSAYVFGFGCVPTESTLYSLMNSFVEDSTVDGEVAQFFRSITAHSPLGSELVSNYVSDNVDTINSELGEEETVTILWDLVMAANDEEEYLKIENAVLFLSYYNSSYLINMTDIAAVNLDWVEKSLPEFMDYVSMQSGVRPVQVSSAEATNSSSNVTSVSSNATSSYASTNYTNTSVSEWYLPGNVYPESYNLSIVPYIEGEDNSTFNGSVIITIMVINATESIVLHASSSLNVTVVSVTNNSTGDAVSVNSTSSNSTTEFLTISLNSSLVAGDVYNVSLEFSGSLEMDNEGFYLTSYKNGSETKYIATTFMKPTFARKVFPCFDEPRFKATFNITVARKSSQTALSNMPLLETSANDSSIGYRVRDTFEVTPPMSTYLVAFTVGELKEVNTSNSNISIYVREEVEDEVAFAVTLAPKLLSALQNYTGYYYPLPKLRIAAVPDMQMGAMESWGLVTVRENRLLLSDLSTTHNKLSVAEVMAHELTQMWFGDLVTISEWGYLWEQEGLASLFERYILDKATDSMFQAMGWLGVERIEAALAADALESAGALTNTTLTSPESIYDEFGVISYSKGAGFLSMLMETYGESTFQKGLNIFLTNNSFEYATPTNFAAALQEAVDDANTTSYNVTVKELVNSWTEKSGYPVVTVMLDYEDFEGATATQSRFLAQAVDDSSSDIWDIPYQFVVRDPKRSANGSGIMSGSSVTLSTGTLSSSSYIIFNYNATGFYRVNYDMHNWLLLSQALSSIESPAQRAAIIDDAFALARSGMLDSWVPLRLVDQLLPKDTSPIVWTAARRGLYHFAALSRGDNDTAEIFRMYLQYVLSDEPFSLVAMRNQWNIEESFETKCARNVLSQLTCEADNVICTSYAQDHFRVWRYNTTVIGNPDIFSATLCAGLRKGDSADFNVTYEVFEDFTAETDRSLRFAFVYGLGCTRSSSSREILLEAAALSDDVFESQEVEPLFLSLIDHSDSGVAEVLNFVSDNFDEIIEVRGFQIATRILQLIAERVYNSTQYDQIAVLACTYPYLETEVALDTAALCLDWVSESSSLFREFMTAAINNTLTEESTPSETSSTTTTAATTATETTSESTSTTTESESTSTTTESESTSTTSSESESTTTTTTTTSASTTSATSTTTTASTSTTTSTPGAASIVASVLSPLVAIILVHLPA